MTSLDRVRFNDFVYSWHSSLFKFDNVPAKGIIGVNYEQRLDVTLLASNRQDGEPLGMSAGAYSVPGFTIRALRSTAQSILEVMAKKSPDGRSYGVPFFSFLAQVSESGQRAITASAPECRIVGKRDFFDEGVDELVTEFTIAALTLSENGLRLWQASQDDELASLGQDYITCGGGRSPGRVTLKGFGRKIGWDERKGYGQDGASLVPTGAHLGGGSLLFAFWTSDQIQAWEAFSNEWFADAVLVVPGALAATKAIGIGHPLLNGPPLFLSDFVVEELGQLENDGTGVWRTEVKLLQYRPPKLAPAPPKGKVPDTGAPVPQNAKEVLIQQLSDQVAKAANG
jgi:hypothetical protein